MSLTIGVLPLARPTFDVPYAEVMAVKAFASLEAAGFAVKGPRGLLFDATSTQAALAALAGEKLDLLLVLQVTFADALMVVEIAKAATCPLAVWAFPEPRAGGRLRLNSFCGLNLAAHALGRAGHEFGWLYLAPDAPGAGERIAALARGEKPALALQPPGPVGDKTAAREILEDLQGTRIGLIGEHPAGFDTCRFDAAGLAKLAGVEVVPFPLAHLFARAKAAAAIPGMLDDWQERAGELAGVEALVPGEVKKSLALAAALEEIEHDNGLSAIAVRCWPETFTDYGCAICAPMGFLTEDGTPCACEADVFGALTCMILNAVAQEPSWLVDVVDMDAASNTAVVWHCGSAPLSMADDNDVPRAQVHSNRKMALLQEFALKPGRITVARLSQARNKVMMVLAGAEVLRAPKSFTGTSGVVRFDLGAGQVLDNMMVLALEHHVSVVYGEHRAALRSLAGEMGIGVVEMG